MSAYINRVNKECRAVAAFIIFLFSLPFVYYGLTEYLQRICSLPK